MGRPKKEVAQEKTKRKEMVKRDKRGLRPGEKSDLFYVSPSGKLVESQAEIDRLTNRKLEDTHDWRKGDRIANNRIPTPQIFYIRKVRGMVVWLTGSNDVSMNWGFEIDFLKEKGFAKHDEKVG